MIRVVTNLDSRRVACPLNFFFTFFSIFPTNRGRNIFIISTLKGFQCSWSDHFSRHRCKTQLGAGELFYRRWLARVLPEAIWLASNRGVPPLPQPLLFNELHLWLCSWGEAKNYAFVQNMIRSIFGTSPFESIIILKTILTIRRMLDFQILFHNHHNLFYLLDFKAYDRTVFAISINFNISPPI